MQNSTHIGKTGEQLTIELLESKGYTMLLPFQVFETLRVSKNERITKCVKIEVRHSFF